MSSRDGSVYNGTSTPGPSPVWTHSSDSDSTSLPPTPHLHPHLPVDTLEDDIDADPQAHFLSPMASYEYWDDSDSDAGEGVEWDAGIVDFGLFYDDHKKADVPLPSKWNGLLADQARAYQRSVQRTNSETVEPEFLAHSASADSLPSLTPDGSPLVRDNLDYDSEEDSTVTLPLSSSSTGRSSSSSTSNSTPPFNLIVSPPQEEDLSTALAAAATDPSSEDDDEDDYLPLEFFIKRRNSPRQPPAAPPSAADFPALERPGMRFERLMSGKRHSWVRPGRGMWSIQEGVDEESAAHGGKEQVGKRRVLRRGRTF